MIHSIPPQNRYSHLHSGRSCHAPSSAQSIRKFHRRCAIELAGVFLTERQPLDSIYSVVSIVNSTICRSCPNFSCCFQSTSARPQPRPTHSPKLSSSNFNFLLFFSFKHHPHQRCVSLLTHRQDPRVFVTPANEKFGVIFNPRRHLLLAKSSWRALPVRAYHDCMAALGIRNSSPAAAASLRRMCVRRVWLWEPVRRLCWLRLLGRPDHFSAIRGVSGPFPTCCCCDSWGEAGVSFDSDYSGGDGASTFFPCR